MATAECRTVHCEPVRVVLDDDASRAIRYLAQTLSPPPASMTALVNIAVAQFIAERAEYDDDYHAPFRELATMRRRHLKVMP